MKRNDKQRIFEVMGRLDKTFKPKLNEDTFRDKNFKFHEGDEVTFIGKDGNQIDGIISDYDYHLMTWKPTYSIKYVQDGKTWTALGIPEEKITLKKAGTEDEYEKRFNQNKMIRGMSENIIDENTFGELNHNQKHQRIRAEYPILYQKAIDYGKKIAKPLLNSIEGGIDEEMTFEMKNNPDIYFYFVWLVTEQMFDIVIDNMSAGVGGESPA